MGWLRRTTLLVLMGVLSGATACGGSRDEGPAAPETASRLAVTATSSDPASVEDCRQLLELRARVEATLSGRAENASDPEALLGRNSDSWPPAIRADIRVIADAYGKIVRALRAAEPDTSGVADPAALKELESTVAGLDRESVAAANANVTSWVTSHC